MTRSTALTNVALTAPIIKVDGAELGAEAAMALLHSRVDRGLSTTGRATLRFIDTDYKLAESGAFALGSDVEITHEENQSEQKIFSGKITGAAVEDSLGGGPEFVVTAADKSFLLALKTRIVAYENMSAGDIVAQLCGDAGLSAIVDALNGEIFPYLNHQGSDLAMLDALTRRCNCVWWVDGATLHTAAAGLAASTVTVEQGKDLLEFSVRNSGLRPTAVSVKGWDMAQKAEIVGENASPEQRAQTQSFAKPGDAESAFGQHPLTVTTASPNTLAEAKKLATSINSTFAANAVTARGTVNVNPAIAPGIGITIANAGPVSGTYGVTEVEHVYNLRGYYTKFVAGPLRQRLLVDSFAATPPDPGLMNFAVASAIVTKIGKSGSSVPVEDRHPGMVRLKFTGNDQSLQSAWGRVVTVGGGNQRGNVFMPEVNDEVLIAFEHGDTRHPVVLGGLFNGTDQFAAGEDMLGSDGKIAYRRITSRAGHVIELSDGPADTKMHVQVTTKGGQKLRIGDDGGEITYKSGKPFKIAIGSSSIEFDGQGNIQIKGAKVTIEAQTDVAITGTNVNVKANAKLALEGGGQAGLKGAMATVESQGITAVKGSMVKIN